ncbi:hypothetical protein [Streptomyces sp. 8L]|uniref:hypothetical protein n=1 Tax=Streptomyces sp. 8L TaxID=2877242 RepID=UPI001CD195A6|nr:hypothetical protein [Streptomyces sp. 8L]MCA1220909.1 hypothetical protein [Streptomyces sp. 8L]
MSPVRSAVASASAVPVSLLVLLVALAAPAIARGDSAGPATAPAPARSASAGGAPAQGAATGPAGAPARVTAGSAAAQNGIAGDIPYYIRDVATGRCIAGTRVATCGTDGTEWVLRDHGDGTVQFQQAGSAAQASEPRCLTLPAMLSYPAAVRMSACDAAASSADAAPDAAGRADRWRIEGWVDSPVTIAHAYPPAGRLFVADSAVRVSNNSSAMWVLDPVVKVKADARR